MFDRHEFFGRAMPAAASLAPATAIAGAQTTATPTANSTARLNTFGPEADRLSRRSGLWDVVETVWDRPEGKPVTTSGLVLERAMLGSMLQEILRPPAQSRAPTCSRTIGWKGVGTMCRSTRERRKDRCRLFFCLATSKRKNSRGDVVIRCRWS